MLFWFIFGRKLQLLYRTYGKLGQQNLVDKTHLLYQLKVNRTVRFRLFLGGGIVQVCLY